MSLVFQGPTSKMLPHCCNRLSSSLFWFLSSPSTRPFWYWSATSPLQKICNCGLDPSYTKPVQLDLFCPIYQITWFDLIRPSLPKSEFSNCLFEKSPNTDLHLLAKRIASYSPHFIRGSHPTSSGICFLSLWLSTEHKSRSSHHIAQEFVVQGAITW